MMRIATVFGIAVTVSHSWGFSMISTGRRPLTGSSSQQQQQPVDSTMQLRLTPQASSVSVCTAELCCCQEERMGGDEILADLRSRNLPYPVDEAPCLGACGGGAMVVIDFEDGSSALVSGIDETLMELGLLDKSNDRTDVTPTSTVMPVPSPGKDPERVGSDAPDAIAVSLQAQGSSVETPAQGREAKMEIRAKRSKTSVELVDVRDRMRAESAAKGNDQSINPWLNVASYLAGKATEKLFGDR